MPENMDTFPLPQKSETILGFLETRRSNLAKVMAAPGPDSTELERILKIGTRVPDHRKLTPWRYIVFQGEARSNIGQHIGAAFKKQNPDVPLDRVMFEAGRMQRAPVVIGVISNPKACPRGTPKWEQELSSAIVCYNLCLAAQASGYGAQWLTEWYAYDRDVLDAMGLDTHEKVSGFIYIGTPTEPPKERVRPHLNAHVTRYS